MRYWDNGIKRDMETEQLGFIEDLGYGKEKYMGIHIVNRLDGKEQLRDKYADMDCDRVITSAEVIDNPNKNEYINRWVRVANS